MRGVRTARASDPGRVRGAGARSRHHHRRHGGARPRVPRQRAGLQPQRPDVGLPDADPPLRLGGAEARVAPAPGARRDPRRPRDHRAGGGLGRVLAHGAGRARRALGDGAIPAERRQDVRHQRAGGRRARHVRLPGPHGREQVEGADGVPRHCRRLEPCAAGICAEHHVRFHQRACRRSAGRRTPRCSSSPRRPCRPSAGRDTTSARRPC